MTEPRTEAWARDRPLEIAMMACPRPQPYAARTLASMFERDVVDVPVRVVVCGTSGAFVDPWYADRRQLGGEPQIRFEELSAAEYAVYPEKTVRWRIAETFLRCVRGAAERQHDLILIQDDIRFAHMWLLHTYLAREAALIALGRRYQRDGMPFVLALFSASRFVAKHTPLAEYAPRKFYGNQALYISREALGPLAAFTAGHKEDMDDMILKDFLVQGGATLYAVNPNLVQHVGDDSTHGGSFIRSPTFKERP